MPLAWTPEMMASEPLMWRPSWVAAIRAGTLSLLLLSASASVHADGAVAADASASTTRLERIRESLVDRALEAPVRVTSNAWVDESGQFRHVTRLFSDLRARALADLDPGTEVRPALSVKASGAASTQSSMPEGTDSVRPAAPASPPAPSSRAAMGQASAVSASSAPASECTRRSDGLKRQAQIRIDTRPFDGAHGRAKLVDLAEFARVELVRQARGAALLQPVTIEGLPGNLYDYRLASNGVFDTPYFVDIEVRSTGVPDRSLKPGAPLEARDITLTLSLVERAADVVVVSRSYPISLSGVTPAVGRADWSALAGPLIRRQVEEWVRLAEESAGCEPFRVRGDLQANSTLQIPVGAGAGVRVGDRWLLSDSARVPSRVLERSAMEGLRIAQVIAVGRHSATLRLESSDGRTAGSLGPDRGVQWVAVPL